MRTPSRFLLSSIVVLGQVACSTQSDVRTTTDAVTSASTGATNPVRNAPLGRPPGRPTPLDRLRNIATRFTQAESLEAKSLNVAPARLPETSSLAAIEATTCPQGALQWGVPVTCGFVPVPLDWSHPEQLGTIRIYFELYRPERTSPAVSAMLFNFGGPGVATTNGHRFIAFYFFPKNLDVHDFLLIDDRGRGNSTTINCPDLQNGTAPFVEATEECAAQLGIAASRYGTGEIAQDTDAVRAALGYDKVDYFGWSYGGADVEAYATRFGNHLRSIVVDSPFGTPAVDPLVLDHARTEETPAWCGWTAGVRPPALRTIQCRTLSSISWCRRSARSPSREMRTTPPAIQPTCELTKRAC